MICPLLIPGEHYSVTDRWPLVMSAIVSTPQPIQSDPLDFLSGNQLLARWTGDEFEIHPAYACDGYSPVLRLFGRWVRITPAPRCGLWPAVLHDALRQFLSLPGCPWTREDTDDWFYDSLIAGGLAEHHAGVYHGAVAGPIGTAWINLTRSPDPALRIVPPAPGAVKFSVLCK